MLVFLLPFFLLYVVMNYILHFFLAVIASSVTLSIGTKIFFSAFIPTILFLSFMLFMDPDMENGGIIFVTLLVAGRIIVLFVNGNHYLEKITLNEESAEVWYRTDFLQQKHLTIPLASIRSVRLDKAERLMDFPCRLQLIRRNGSVEKLLIIDRGELQQHEMKICALVRKLEFTEK